MIKQALAILLVALLASCPTRAVAWVHEDNICYATKAEPADIFLCVEKDRHVIQLNFKEPQIVTLTSIKLIAGKRVFPIEVDRSWRFEEGIFNTYYLFPVPRDFLNHISNGGTFKIKVYRDGREEVLKLNPSQEEALRLIASID